MHLCLLIHKQIERKITRLSTEVKCMCCESCDESKENILFIDRTFPNQRISFKMIELIRIRLSLNRRVQLINSSSYFIDNYSYNLTFTMGQILFERNTFALIRCENHSLIIPDHCQRMKCFFYFSRFLSHSSDIR